MSLLGKKTRSLLERARKVIPYGVNSNFRYYGEDTFVIKRGQGAHVWDADDKQYIDYRLGFGPIILGHAHPTVTQRVTEAIKGGTLFAWTNPWEISAAERIVRLTRMDKVKLTNTGSEATMHALRTARAYTGREKFVKFEGHYHGMNDYFLYSTASSAISAIGSRLSCAGRGVFRDPAGDQPICLHITVQRPRASGRNDPKSLAGPGCCVPRTTAGQYGRDFAEARFSPEAARTLHQIRHLAGI